MDARSGDARRASARRSRLLRDSAAANALDNSPEPPPRRVAGQRPTDRRDALAAAAHESGGAPPEAPHQSPQDAPPEATQEATHEAPVDPSPADVQAPGSGELFRFDDDEDEAAPPASATVRRAVVAVCAVGVLAAGGLTAYVLTHRSSSTPTAAPSRPSTSTIQQAETWIRANLARSARVRTDSTVASDLLFSGYTATGVLTSIDSQDAGDSLLVTTPEIREHARKSLADVASRISPLSVASFGTGSGQVEIALLVDGNAASLSQRLARDSNERRMADRALLANPRVVTDPAIRPWLADGRLDLRAATVVALLASRTDVRLTRVTLDRAEAPLARPARTLTLSMTDPAALAAVQRALPAAYAPARVSTLPGGARQLTWSVGLAPEGL
ncbi:MAG TPA: hypothetical protein VGL39_17395 [Jatrophihabitantaceae bacterium]|jgi:hypothetical protein